MKPLKPGWGLVALVNAKLGYAVLLGAVAWLVWPASPEWYGFTVLSFMAGAGAAGLLISAFAQIRKIHRFEKEQERMLAQGRQVKSSALASSDFLTDKGVIRK